MDDVLTFAHRLVKDAVERGDVVIDATAGNGHDTLFLAQAVGPTGRVYGFDVQAEALVHTRRLLGRHETIAPVTLVHEGHETMPEHLPDVDQSRVSAVMFNLGYLPRADKSIITRPATTVPALDHATRMVRPGGIVSIVVYTGHEGGAEEGEAVDAWARALDQEAFRVLTYRFINQRNHPPYLIAVQKVNATPESG